MAPRDMEGPRLRPVMQAGPAGSSTTRRVRRTSPWWMIAQQRTAIKQDQVGGARNVAVARDVQGCWAERPRRQVGDAERRATGNSQEGCGDADAQRRPRWIALCERRSRRPSGSLRVSTAASSCTVGPTTRQADATAGRRWMSRPRRRDSCRRRPEEWKNGHPEKRCEAARLCCPLSRRGRTASRAPRWPVSAPSSAARSERRWRSNIAAGVRPRSVRYTAAAAPPARTRGARSRGASARRATRSCAAGRGAPRPPQRARGPPARSRR